MRRLDINNSLMQCASPQSITQQIIARVGPTDSYTVVETRVMDAVVEVIAFLLMWKNSEDKINKAACEQRLLDIMPTFESILEVTRAGGK